MHNIQNDQCASHHTDSVSCNTYEVQKILQTLDISKSAGVDKIPARLLKETAHTSPVPLSMLYNLLSSAYKAIELSLLITPGKSLI